MTPLFESTLQADRELLVCRQAAMLLRGKHDFTQFSSVPNATFPVSPIKTLTRAEVLEVPGGMKLVFAGSGFLYNQCRHMAGCLIRVGMGRLSLDTVQGLLQLGKQQGRVNAFHSAAAKNTGLNV